MMSRRKRLSIAANRCIGGPVGETLCAHAYRSGWARFDGAMQILFRDPTHCEGEHLDRLALPENVNQRTDP